MATNRANDLGVCALGRCHGLDYRDVTLELLVVTAAAMVSRR